MTTGQRRGFPRPLAGDLVEFPREREATLSDCVFCARDEQPAPLFETAQLYVMPDKYPLTPGHTLIISKDHLSCYGAASGELHAELEEAAEKASGFLRSAYGNPIFMWENGVAGQSVHHAHLHLIPFPGARDDEVIPAEIGEHADVSAIDAWDAVRAHFDQHRSYRYLRFGAERRVLPGHSPVLRALVRWMSQGTGLRYGPRGWIKTTTPSDVIEANRRWEAWQRTASHAVLSAESRL